MLVDTNNKIKFKINQLTIQSKLIKDHHLSLTFCDSLEVQNALNALTDLPLTLLRLLLHILMKHPMEVLIPRQYLEKQQPILLRVEIQVEQDLLLA